MAGTTFGKSWFRAKKRLTELWDARKARTAHEQRLPYAAVMESSEGIHCFIENNNDYIGVGFLDSSLREFLSYQFVEVEPGRLFLKMATYREFDCETDRVKSGTTYYFKPDGTVPEEHFQRAAVQKPVQKPAVTTRNYSQSALPLASKASKLPLFANDCEPVRIQNEFLRHPDAQSSVWATPPNKEGFSKLFKPSTSK